MIRAGKLDRQITLERSIPVPLPDPNIVDADGFPIVRASIDENGTPVRKWETLATVWAELIQASTTDYIRGYGDSSEAVFIFRIRYHAGLTLADRVGYGGKQFLIKDIKELGRREALELRCEAVGA